ncbi:MAG TPA: 3-hydroxyacyl-CoA dehydrogenase NAD-binding domain-containing protein [Spirochaetia bacterium]|nr:3-hydroxyacyl-CoA dehydrogenase NAD-binding domain-containing protein [Spirochaetia bacterium]
MMEAANHGAFRLTAKDGIAELVFDVPGEKLNILRRSIMEELATVASTLPGRSDIRCLLFRSGKPGTFIAGADIHEIEALRDPREAEEKSRNGQDLFNVLADLPYPTVAVIDGAAVGGGLELALACTYRLVSDNPKTQLGLPETGLGIVPGFGGSYRLPRAVGLVQAIRMILSGKPVDGPRAAKIGLAAACYPATFLDDRAREFAARLASGKTGTGTPSGASGSKKRRKRGAFGRWLSEGNPIGRALVFRRARKDIMEKGGKHYPALLEALTLLRRTWRAPRSKALELERRALGRTASSQVCRNLTSLFFAREAARHIPNVEGQSPSFGKTSQAAVIGAGVMGGKIAWLFAHHDVPVVMKDVNWDAVQKGYRSAYETFQDLAKRGRVDRRKVNLGMHRLSGAVDYASMGMPDAVIEAVVENISVKKKVLAEVERRVSSQALLASNTSSLSITEMAEALERPERFVGIHFFNPPSIMPLVEIIPGAKTSPDTVRRASRLALDLGKTPIVVKDSPGFLVNRLLMPYLNECVALVEEGADFRAVDKLLEEFGMPMGPFALLDEIGIDVAAHVAKIIGGAFGDRMKPDAVLSGIESEGTGLLGRKSGKGFYLYAHHSKGERRVNPEMQRLLPRSGGRTQPTSFDIVHRPLLAMLNEASRALEEGIVSSPRDVDLALILGTGFPPFRGGILRWAEDELGITKASEMLEIYARTVGQRFAPSPLVSRLSAESKGFSSVAAA